MNQILEKFPCVSEPTQPYKLLVFLAQLTWHIQQSGGIFSKPTGLLRPCGSQPVFSCRFLIFLSLENRCRLISNSHGTNALLGLLDICHWQWKMIAIDCDRIRSPRLPEVWNNDEFALLKSWRPLQRTLYLPLLFSFLFYLFVYLFIIIIIN